jgi:predicted phosphodiesterase
MIRDQFDAAPVLRADGPVLCFGGPYSNLQATRAVLAEARRLGIPPARILCTGDVAAYCADAAATLDLVMASGIAVIAGNCEESLAADNADCGCGFEGGTACDLLSRAWYAHAARQVTPEQRAWMAALPSQRVLEIAGRRLAVLHGGANSTSRFLFASAAEQTLRDELAATGCDGIVAGHCGLPFTRRVGAALWHNPGAIGMPADDGTPRGWFSLLRPDPDGLRVEHRALRYDHIGAMAAMRQAGLPPDYRLGLASGLWPSRDVLPPAERALAGRPRSETSLLWPAAG